MARRRRRSANTASDEEGEDWMVTYADAITLLMAFFVMLVSFSRIELPMFEQVQAGIAEQIGGVAETDTPIFSLEANMRSVLSEASAFPPDAIEVGFDDDGVVIDLGAGHLFEPGTTRLTPAGMEVLTAVREQLAEPPYDIFLVQVEGHTSNAPPPADTLGARFETNWELSAAQAARVVRGFIALGMQPQWLSASGYADTEPKVPNLGLTGEPIVANQRKNERITLRLHPD